MLFKNVVLINVLLALMLSHLANASEALSWNLSRDMMNGIKTNPTSHWTFMSNTTGIDNPVNYKKIPYYSEPCSNTTPYYNCWHIEANRGLYPLVAIATKTFKSRGTTVIKGIPVLHPAINSPIILKWKSPIDGNVNIVGRVSAFDQNCSGDGINWSLKDKDAVIIKSGHLNKCTGSVFLAENIAIKKTESVYFAVDKNLSLNNDSTYLDILITSQQ